MPTLQINILVLGQAIKLGTPKLNTMVKDLGDVTMEFSALLMYEVHAIQNYVVVERKNKEHALVNQVKSSHKTINKMKKTIQEA